MDPKQLVSILAQVGLFLIVASFGLQGHAREVLATMRRTDLVLKGIFAVNIAVPLAAIVICSFLPIDPSVRIGIVIMAVSPLSPLVPGKMLKAGLGASTAVGLYIALIFFAALIVPATVALLSAIYPADASISVFAVAKLVAVSILLPLLVGLALGTWAPAFALRIAKIASIVGGIAILLLLLLILYAHGRATLGLVGDGSVLAIIVIVATGLAVGHFLGKPDPATSSALGMAAAVRNPGIAALIVNQNFEDKRVLLALVLFLLTSVLVTAVYQRWMSRKLHPKPDGSVSA